VLESTQHFDGALSICLFDYIYATLQFRIYNACLNIFIWILESALGMELELSGEDEAFVIRMTHDSDGLVREDISHILLMLRKLSSSNYYDIANFVAEDIQIQFTEYLGRYKTFIQARKALDGSHPMRKIILERIAAMNTPLEDLLSFQETKNVLEFSESQTSVATSGLRRRSGVNLFPKISDHWFRSLARAESLFRQVIKDLDQLEIYILMDPSK
jgi:transcription elongation factor GreA-like protein